MRLPQVLKQITALQARALSVIRMTAIPEGSLLNARHISVTQQQSTFSVHRKFTTVVSAHERRTYV